MWWTRTLRTLANEDFGPAVDNDPLTGYEVNDIHISETTEKFIQESSGDNWSFNLHDLEFDDSEKMQRAVDKLTTLLTKVCRPVSRRLSVLLEQVDLFLISLTHQSQTPEKILVATQKMSKSGFFWNDKKADSRCLESRLRNTSSRPIMTKVSKS